MSGAVVTGQVYVGIGYRIMSNTINSLQAVCVVARSPFGPADLESLWLPKDLGDRF